MNTKKQKDLSDLVPPLHFCKQIPHGEFQFTAMCWRTFNKGRNDEYTIVFPTGTLDPHDDDVPAPTAEEIMEDLATFSSFPTLYYNKSGFWVADCDVSPTGEPDIIDNFSKQYPALAMLGVWFQAKGIEVK